MTNQELRDIIIATIKANGNKEITGPILQDILIDIVDTYELRDVTIFNQESTPTALLTSDLWYKPSILSLSIWNGVTWEVMTHAQNTDNTILNTGDGTVISTNGTKGTAGTNTFEIFNFNINQTTIPVVKFYANNTDTVERVIRVYLCKGTLAVTDTVMGGPNAGEYNFNTVASYNTIIEESSVIIPASSGNELLKVTLDATIVPFDDYYLLIVPESNFADIILYEGTASTYSGTVQTLVYAGGLFKVGSTGGEIFYFEIFNLDTIAQIQTNTNATTTVTGTLLGSDLTLTGTLDVQTLIQSQTLQVSDNLIETRYDAVVGLGVGVFTGIQAHLYDGSNDGQLVFDKDGWARVGDVGNLSRIAAIELAPTDTGIAYYDLATFELITSSNLTFDGTTLTVQTSTTGGVGNIVEFYDSAVSKVAEITDEGNLLIQSSNAISKVAINNWFLAGAGSTSITSAHSNVGVGELVFEDLTSGYGNTVSGFNAGMNITTAFKNTFYGHNAGKNMTIGRESTYIGYDVAIFGTSGATRNTFIGYEIANAATLSGGSNVGIGHQPLYKISSGDNNVVIGRSAGWNIGSGDNNVLIGNNAGFNLTGSDNNTFLGYLAGFASISATGKNICVGAYSGYYETGVNTLLISSLSNIEQVNEATARTKAIIYGVQDTTTANQILALNAAVTISYDLNLLEELKFQDATISLSRDIYDNLVFEDPNTGIITLNELSTGGIGASTVSISAADTTSSYLDSKVTEGNGIVTTILNPAAVETLELSISSEYINNSASGNFNWYIGGAAPNDNISGNSNLAFGLNALNPASGTTTQAIAIGTQALQSLSSGTNVIAIGTGVAQSATNLTETILIGTGSGNTLTTGHIGNTFIGHNSGYYETGSDKLFISSLSSGEQVNEATARTKALIYGVNDTTTANQTLTFNASVGIGTIAPITGFSNSTVNNTAGSLNTNSLYWDTSGTGYTAIFNNETLNGPGVRIQHNGGVGLAVFDDNASLWEIVTKDGFVGIGEADPDYLLHTKSPTSGTVWQIATDNSNHNRGLAIGSASGEVKIQAYAPTLGPGGTGQTLSINATGGNVGIGTPTPNTPLDILRSQNAASLIKISNATAGTASTAGLLVVGEGNNIYMESYSDSHSTKALENWIYTTAGTTDIVLGAAGGEGLRVTSAAYTIIPNRLRVGSTTAPSYPLHVQTSTVAENALFWNARVSGASYAITAKLSSYSGYAYIAFRNGANTLIGSVAANGSTAVTYNTTSDRNLKNDIVDLPYAALDVLTQLRPRQFKYEGNEHTNIGFIAQEALEVSDISVTDYTTQNIENGSNVGDSDYMYMQMNYTEYIPLIVKGMQEQKSEVDLLNDKIAELTNRITILEA